MFRSSHDGEPSFGKMGAALLTTHTGPRPRRGRAFAKSLLPGLITAVFIFLANTDRMSMILLDLFPSEPATFTFRDTMSSCGIANSIEGLPDTS